MADTFEVIVAGAGAGPGGCIFARDLANAGITVNFRYVTTDRKVLAISGFNT